MRHALSTVLVLLVCAPAAGASVAREPWPPTGGPGQLFVHYGEEHWNDDDGLTLLPEIVEESARYRPALVTTSGDKANDGTVDQLSTWESIMARYDRLGVPYLAGIGNHDRTSPPGVPPGTAGLLTPAVQGDLSNYKQVFGDRPHPFGDAPSYPGIGPARRAGEPAGASSHYFADVGRVRWIFLDNSCWGLTDCDSTQSPPFPDAQGNATQLGFLERTAGEAQRRGMTAFVVMHMPTRDPRDQSYIDQTTFHHVMGKGLSPTGTPDNERFELISERTGVDGVFVGHIKGQFLYRGRGEVPYYIDGGAGGELYTEGPVGADHGYWHGFRLVRVDGTRVITDAVPIFVEDGIRVEGADVVRPGKRALFSAFGRQPVFRDPAKVEALELRDPDPVRPTQRAGLGGLLRDDGLALAPLILLMLGGVAMTARHRGRRGGRIAARRPRQHGRPDGERVHVGVPASAGVPWRALGMACTATSVAVVGMAAISLAQQSAPTTTPLESLPSPARVFTTSNEQVLAPVGSPDDDPRRDRRTQTEDGLFSARCPGSVSLRVTSGFETSVKPVSVPSRPGGIVRRARVLSPGIRPGRRRAVARIGLAQAARVLVRVRRRGRTLRTLADACLGRGVHRVSWDGRVRRAGRRGAGRLRPARPRGYAIQVVVRSDRPAVKRLGAVRVLPRRR